jgi:GntR family transcriptional regulator
MMQIKIDFRSDAPIYVQIMEQIQQKVALSELKPGDQLPTVRQLATDLRVNFNTVARAYRLLDEAGLISTQLGRGTYIWETPSEETRQKIRRHGLEGLTNRYLNEAHRQGYTPEEISQAVQEQINNWKNGDTPHSSPEK